MYLVERAYRIHNIGSNFHRKASSSIWLRIWKNRFALVSISRWCQRKALVDGATSSTLGAYISFIYIYLEYLEGVRSSAILCQRTSSPVSINENCLLGNDVTGAVQEEKKCIWTVPYRVDWKGSDWICSGRDFRRMEEVMPWRWSSSRSKQQPTSRNSNGSRRRWRKTCWRRLTRETGRCRWWQVHATNERTGGSSPALNVRNLNRRTPKQSFTIGDKWWSSKRSIVNWRRDDSGENEQLLSEKKWLKTDWWTTNRSSEG